MQKQLAGRSLGRMQHRAGVLLFLTLSAAVLGCGGDSGDNGADDERDARADEKPRADAGAKKDGGTTTNRTLGGRLGATAAAPCSPDSPCTDGSVGSDAGVATSADGGTAQTSDGGSAPSSDGGSAPSSDGGSAPSSDGGSAPSSDAGNPPSPDAGGSSNDASTPKPDAGTTPTSMCPAAAADDACDRCLKGKCCSELSTCAADQSCLNLASCVDSCFDTYCLDTCDALYPRAVNKYYAFSDCAETSCLDACSASGG